MRFVFKSNYQIEDLLSILQLLRAENGCPWDREQTHASIRQNLLEEAYEVAEAIDAKQNDMLCEELGDLLLQVVFHSQMANEEGAFDFNAVADGICKKLILRHPHIFGDVQADTTELVLQNWETIKQREKGQTTASDTLAAVPITLPALMRAQKLQKRAAKTGFDYPDLQMAVADLKSEVAELEEAIAAGQMEDIGEELGDLLFSCVNVARFLKQDAELLLTQSSEKFTTRFAMVERLAQETNADLSQMNIDGLNDLWRQAKIQLSGLNK